MLLKRKRVPPERTFGAANFAVICFINAIKNKYVERKLVGERSLKIENFSYDQIRIM